MKTAKSRSLVKALTWRVIAASVTFICIYILTGKGNLAGVGTFFTNAINFILYYLHERAWNRISWGENG
jgi:uncharacterized membrane protein